MERFLAY